MRTLVKGQRIKLTNLSDATRFTLRVALGGTPAPLLLLGFGALSAAVAKPPANPAPAPPLAERRLEGDGLRLPVHWPGGANRPRCRRGFSRRWAWCWCGDGRRVLDRHGLCRHPPPAGIC